MKKFKIYYDYVNYSNPADLLADFVDELGSVPKGRCFPFQNSGNYDIYLSELDSKGNPIYVNFIYSGISFEIIEEHPRGKEISDLFVKYLIEKKVPQDLYEKKVILERKIFCDSCEED